MNERVVEILIYIMNEIRTENRGIGKLDLLSQELMQRGYTENEINSAFSWLFEKIESNFEELVRNPGTTSPHSFRILHDIEKMVIAPAAYGYLIQLRELGLIDDIEMEQVIEKALILGTTSVGVNDIKAIVASMMFNPDDFMDGSYFLLDNLSQVH